jgi:hypothetical protein
MTEAKSIKIKIGKHEYDITEADRFLDNGACTQLMTQSKEKKHRYDTERPLPKLSATLIKKINGMELIQHTVPERLAGCKIFSIKIKD